VTNIQSYAYLVATLRDSIDLLISEIGHCKDILSRRQTDCVYVESIRVAVDRKQAELRYLLGRKAEAQRLLDERAARLTQRNAQQEWNFGNTVKNAGDAGAFA